LSKGLIFIDFSIQGPEEIHNKVSGIKNSFNKVTENIKKLQDEKKRTGKKYPIVNIKTVVTESTVSGLYDIYKKAVELNADICSFLVCSSIESNFIRFDFKDELTGINDIISKPASLANLDTNLLRAELDKIKKEENQTGVQVRFSPQALDYEKFISYHENKINLKEYSCGSPWTKLYISAYGDVMSCFNRTLGNIREDSVKKVWKHPILNDLRERLTKAKGIFPACIGCCQSEYRG